MHIHYQPIERADATGETRALIDSYNTILTNHVWHTQYDDHDGYPGSAICQENEAALFCLTHLIDDARQADLQFEIPGWLYMVMGAVAMYCCLCVFAG